MTPLFADAARPARHGTAPAPAFVDETYVKARRFLTRALRYGPAPVEVTADKAGWHLRVVPHASSPTPSSIHRWRTVISCAEHCRPATRS